MSRPRNTKNVTRARADTISKRRNPPTVITYYTYTAQILYHKYCTTCACIVYYMHCAPLRVYIALKGFLWMTVWCKINLLINGVREPPYRTPLTYVKCTCQKHDFSFIISAAVVCIKKILFLFILSDIILLWNTIENIILY